MSSLRRTRNTKIVATIGPASSAPETIRQLILAGVDVFRMNFSHGSHEDHGLRYRAIRLAEQETGRPIAIMADLQGPKLRLGTFRDGKIDVTPGQKLRLDLDRTPGDAKRVCLPHAEIFAAMQVGTELLVDDGKARLVIRAHGTDWAEAEILVGKQLSDRKGVNVPNAILPLCALTPKDRQDLDYALSLGVDWVALSFVQKAEDLQDARALIGERAALLAKIEKPSAIQFLDEIIAAADGIMVARGDLGVELPAEDVPGIQKRIVAATRQAGKPVIVATQMLESMITAPTPTRAEASDVATAVFDGSDAVMLSAETASGAYPLEAVSIMNRICHRVEHDPLYRTLMDNQRAHTDHSSSAASDAITIAARQVADTVKAALIVTYTDSGSTTQRAARERPSTPILSITRTPQVARRMMLLFGVHAVLSEEVHSETEMADNASKLARTLGYAVNGQRLVITAGVPFGRSGTTNLLRIVTLE
jgi:pyruvate kinase